MFVVTLRIVSILRVIFAVKKKKNSLCDSRIRISAPFQNLEFIYMPSNAHRLLTMFFSTLPKKNNIGAILM